MTKKNLFGVVSEEHMKSYTRFRCTIWLIAILSLPFSLFSQAPDNINYVTFEVSVDSAGGDEFEEYAGSKWRALTSSNKLFAIVPLNDDLDGGAGIYDYLKISSAKSIVTAETNRGTVIVNLEFKSSTTGLINLLIFMSGIVNGFSKKILKPFLAKTTASATWFEAAEHITAIDFLLLG